MSTILTLPISATDTTLFLNDTSTFPANGGILQIESEQILFLASTDRELKQCTRGYNGTSAASHAAKVVVTSLSPVLPYRQVLGGVFEITSTGAPTNNLTGVPFADTGSRYTDTITGFVYTNQGTALLPTWVLVDAGVTGGITQLTGDVTAGPGSGSQPATLTTVNSSPGSFTNASLTVNAKGLVTAASSGPVPNVVQTLSNQSPTTSSSTPTATSYTVTITPSKTTSKIRLLTSFPFYSPTASVVCHGTIFRGATNLAAATAPAAPYFCQYRVPSANMSGTVSMVYIDSPSTTSAVTYTIYISNNDNATAIFANGDGAAIVFTAEEIFS